MRLKSDQEVLLAFSNRTASQSKNLVSDGNRLSGEWVGGSDIAVWSGGRVAFSDLGSEEADRVQQALRGFLSPGQIQGNVQQKMAAVVAARWMRRKSTVLRQTSQASSHGIQATLQVRPIRRKG